MPRFELTAAQQSFVDNARAELGANFGDPTNHDPNVNTVVGDHFLVDQSSPWKCIVLGASTNSVGCLECYMPEWGEFYLPLWQVEYLVFDRAGPNNETMPVVVQQAMAARAEGAPDPQTATQAERGQRRDTRTLLRDALKRLPDNDDRKRARDAMRKAGVLGQDDSDEK